MDWNISIGTSAKKKNKLLNEKKKRKHDFFAHGKSEGFVPNGVKYECRRRQTKTTFNISGLKTNVESHTDRPRHRSIFRRDLLKCQTFGQKNKY